MKQTDAAEMQDLKSKDNEISIVDVLIALAKHKKKLVVVPLVAALASIAFTLFMPDVYKATTKLMPPQQSSSTAAALMSQLGGVAGLAAGAVGAKNPNDLYIAMLKSRTIADRLIDRFQLEKVYNTDSRDRARTKLAANTNIVSGKDGLITLEFYDKDQKLVAKLANSYIDELVRLSRVLAVTEASQRRVFFEQQLALAKDNLAKAESLLTGGIEAKGVISADVESTAVLETVAKLKAQVSVKEIQLDSMRPFYTANHPNFKRLNEELNSLKAELARLQYGRGEPDKVASGNQASTSGAVQNIQLLRDVKYYQTLYEILAKQYEAARLDEAKNPVILQVMDPALEPERKFKPARTIIVVISTVLAFFAAILWALVAESKRKYMLSAARVERWNEFRAHLRVK